MLHGLWRLANRGFCLLRGDHMSLIESSADPLETTSSPAAEGSPPGQEFTRWRDGDRDGLEALVRRLSPTLWHVSRAYGLDPATAEDVVQLTWLALLRHADEVRDPGAVAGWITTVCRRESLRAARAHPRESLGLAPTTIDLTEDAAERPDEQAVAAAEAQRLWRHVARLTERCQRLLRVVAFAERPDYATLSTQLGIPIGGIGPTRRRCLDKLRHLLDSDPAWSES